MTEVKNRVKEKRRMKDKRVKEKRMVEGNRQNKSSLLLGYDTSVNEIDTESESDNSAMDMEL